MTHSNFHIINAAAGSGKTYTLVLYYLRALLGSKTPRPYRHMLALTFTNKAVNEMKARILESLQDLSHRTPKDPQLQKNLALDLGIDSKELINRAEKMLRNIIFEYGSFDVITLDKFTHRIVRTFAREFELPQGFEVVLDSKSILDQVVRSVIDQIGKDEYISHLLLELSLSKVNQGMSWDVQTDLEEFASLLLNENDRIPLADLREKNRKTHKSDQAQLESALKNSEIKVKALVNDFTELLEDHTLKPDDFIRQILHKHLDFVLKGAYEKLYKNKLEAMLSGEGSLYKKNTETSIKEQIDRIRPKLYSLFLSLKKQIGFSLLLKKTLRYWTPRLIFQQIEQGLETLQIEKEIRLLGEFNHKISSLVQAEEAPYIYSRLGERYQHFFLDEFQDTSALQWSNLIPLIGNALESESLSGDQGSLVLVGDPKQAIYRWRGGDIAQFINLLNKKSKPFQVEAFIKNLDVNYRSDEAIVMFNNTFFSHLTHMGSSIEVQSIYGDGSQQKLKNPGGYVQVKAIAQGGKQEEKIPLYVQETLEAIEKAINLNYQQKEIAVLVRKKIQSVAIGEGLTTQGYKILSSDALAVGKSSQVQSVIAALKLLKRPNSGVEHKLIFDQFWEWHKGQKTEYFRVVKDLIHRSSSEFFEYLNRTYGSSYCPNKRTGFSLIETVDYIIASFPFLNANDPFIVTFLEDVFEFSKQKKASLSDYLIYWETQSEKLRLATPENMNAIRIMTIHQAKGLEFPVVILPFMDTPIHPNLKDKIWYSFQNSSLENIQWGWFNFSSQMPLYGEAAKSLYEQELIAKELDALNVLYVALTRAKNQLYVITQETKEVTEAKTYADLFTSYVLGQGHDLDQNTPFEMGAAIPRSSAEKVINENDKLEVEIGISNHWKNHLIVFPRDLDEVSSAQEKGLLMHDLLSKITHKDLLSEVMDEEFQLGIISEGTKNIMEHEINQIINHPELETYFEGTDRVLCEREILIPNGPILRPDRINITSDGSATVLDYKTGTPKIEDEEQIESYRNALIQLGFKQVKSKLVYINNEIKIISKG